MLVATHQKTQQGLKRWFKSIYYLAHDGRNASENPAGIETSLDNVRKGYRGSRNASENPAGIETYLCATQELITKRVATHQKTQQGLKQRPGHVRLNQQDHVATHQKTQQGLKLTASSRYTINIMVATHQKTRAGLKLHPPPAPPSIM